MWLAATTHRTGIRLMTLTESDEGLPRVPERPEFPSEEPSRSRRGGFLVLLFAVMALALILAAISVVSVGFTIVLAIGLCLILFHYVVWGWWLSKIIIEEENAGDER